MATFDAVSRPTSRRWSSLLGDVGRTVLVLAGDAEHGVALQFVHDLNALRPGVASWSPGTRSPCAARSRLTAVPATLVVIDLRRYERWLLEAFEQAREAGTRSSRSRTGRCRRWRWPPTTRSPSPRTSVSPFDSHMGTLALLELLVADVAERLRGIAADRLEQVEAAWAAAGSLADR